MNDMPAPPPDGASPAGSDSSAPSDSHGAGGAQYSSQAGPQYRPQPGPTPPYQQYGGPRPEPQNSSTRRFFDSLRG